MGQLTDVIKNLIIINVIVFFALKTPFLAEYKNDLVLYFFGDTRMQPVQIVSHMFLHADEMHLIMNMLSLFFLGPTVERFVGPKNFFILYFAAGLGAVLLRWAAQMAGFTPIGSAALGASGAVVGVVTAFAALFPNQKLFLMFVPIPIKAKYLIGAFLAWDLFAGLNPSMNTGIAHFAHLGGAVVGFLLTWFWFKKYDFRGR